LYRRGGGVAWCVRRRSIGELALVRSRLLTPIARSVACLLVCAACTGKDVVAKVGSREVKVADVNALVSARAMASRPDPSAALEQLIDRELLAEGARRAGLADDPVIAARLRGLEREVLAQAMIDKEMKAIDETALKKRYEEKRDTLKTREVHVAQIFITVGKEPQLAESKASAAYARLADGDAFDVVAGEVCDDKPSASRGTRWASPSRAPASGQSNACAACAMVHVQ